MPNRSGSSAAQTATQVEERELRAAHEIARAFLAASVPNEVYRLALTRLAPVVHADFAAVFLRADDDTDALRPVVVHGWPQASAIYLGQLRIRVGRGPTGIAVADNTAVEVEDVFADARLAEWWQPARELGFTAMISLPLCNEDGAIGAVSFYFVDSRVFNAEERRLLQLIAEQLAATAARINVVDSLRAEKQRLESENEVFGRQLESLRAEVRSQDELISDVGHDLVRALRAVRDTLRGDRTGDAILSTDAAERIATDLVTLCSLRLGHGRTDFAPQDASRLARAAIEDAQPVLNVPVTANDPGMVVPVSTDGAAVIRILSALITHALQSTVRGQASLRVERKDDEVVWVLTVNGLGIERALHESVGNGTGTPAVGSSLDLALAHRRAAALGGRIVMLSEPGASRSYALCLPSQQPPRH